MPLCIVYPSSLGHLCLSYVGAGQDAEEVASAVVPSGVPHRVVDADVLPQDFTYQRAWVIDFSDPESAVSVDPAIAAEIDAELAIEELDKWFESELAEGVTTAGGWTLGMSQEDVSLLTGNFVLAKEAAALGMPVPPIIDADGVPHEMSGIEELTAIMLAYGQRRAELSAEYAAKKAEILGG